MNPEGAFDFYLSPAEVHWLAGAFGVAWLPLPDDPLRDRPRFQVEAGLQEAFSSLQVRGLLRLIPGIGWQLDRLPAALVRWVGEAEWMLCLEVQPREKPSRRRNIFPAGEEALVVFLENGVFHFALYPDSEQLIAETLVWLDGPWAETSLPEKHVFVLPEPETVIRAAWRDRSTATSILRAAKMSPEKSEAVLGWLDSLQWLVSCACVQLAGEKIEVERRSFWCGDGRWIWVGDIIQEERGQRSLKTVLLSPFPAKGLPNLLHRLLNRALAA